MSKQKLLSRLTTDKVSKRLYMNEGKTNKLLLGNVF